MNIESWHLKENRINASKKKIVYSVFNLGIYIRTWKKLSTWTTPNEMILLQTNIFTNWPPPLLPLSAPHSAQNRWEKPIAYFRGRRIFEGRTFPAESSRLPFPFPMPPTGDARMFPAGVSCKRFWFSPKEGRKHRGDWTHKIPTLRCWRQKRRRGMRLREIVDVISHVQWETQAAVRG